MPGRALGWLGYSTACLCVIAASQVAQCCLIPKPVAVWCLQALAAILGKPLKVDKIRAGRDKPGVPGQARMGALMAA